eukprot:3849184-Rhodomonas_salina.1
MPRFEAGDHAANPRSPPACISRVRVALPNSMARFRLIVIVCLSMLPCLNSSANPVSSIMLHIATPHKTPTRCEAEPELPATSMRLRGGGKGPGPGRRTKPKAVPRELWKKSYSATWDKLTIRRQRPDPMQGRSGHPTEKEEPGNYWAMGH